MSEEPQSGKTSPTNGVGPVITSSNPAVVPVYQDEVYQAAVLAKAQIIDDDARELLKRAQNTELGSKARAALVERAMARLSEKSGGGSRRTKIDYSLPKPTFQRYAAYTVIEVPDADMTRAAFLDIDLEKFVDLLVGERQETDTEMAQFTDDMPPNATADILAKWKEFNMKREELGELHYAIVAAGCQLFYVLDNLLRDYDAVPLLYCKDWLANAIIEYNAHNPFLGTRLEQVAIRNLHSEVLKITASAVEFMLGAGFRQSVAAKSAPPPAPVPISPNAPLAGPTAPPPPVPLLQVSIARVNFAASVSNKNKVKRIAVTTDNKGKRGNIKTMFQVAVEPPAIDLSEGRNPADVMSDFENLFNALVQQGIELIDVLRASADEVDYNINSNTFGSRASKIDNVSMMETVRRRILQYMNRKRNVKGKTRPARILLMSCFEWKAFNLGIGPCELVSTQTFFANEERKIRLKTSETDKETRTKSQNVLTSNSSEVQDNIQKTVEKEVNDNNTQSQDRTDYLDQSRQQTDTQTNQWHIDANLNIPYIGLGFSAGISENKNKTVTQGTKQGSSTTTNNTCEKAVRDFESAVTGQVQTTAAKQEINVQDSAESSTETTKEETTEITVKNPNEASPVTVAFYTIVQEYLTTHTLTDMKLIFWNGQVREEFILPEMQLMLDRYIRPESSIRALVVDEVTRSGIRFDYMNRRFDVLDESEGYFRFKNNHFLDQLVEVKKGLSAEVSKGSDDEVLEDFNQHLPGVVVKVARHTMPRPGLLSRSYVDEPALDENQQKLWEQTYALRKAEADMKTYEALKQKTLIDTVTAIEDPKERAEWAQKLLVNPGQLVNNTFLGQLLDGAKHGVINPLGFAKLER